MENFTSMWLQQPNTTPFARETTEKNNGGLIYLEQTLFLCCITVVSALAAPPNLLMLHLSTQVPQTRASKRTSLSAGSCKVSHLPLLLISQIISNLLISLTAPLDVLFLIHRGRDDTSCVLFLSVKSVVMLFSVLVVCLQGMDKVYRVQNLQKMFLKNQAGWKLLAIVVSVLLSAVPLILELSLKEGHPLHNGCHVLPVVVDVTEGIFFLGFTLSTLSLLAVVIMLHKHKRKVAVEDGENVSVISASSRVLPATSRLPSVSEAVTEHNDDRSVEAGTLTTETSANPATRNESSTIQGQAKPSLNEDSKRFSTAAPAISLERSPTHRQISMTSMTGTSGLHLSPVDSECFFQTSEASPPDAPSENCGPRVVPGPSSKSGRGSIKGGVRWSTPTQASEDGGRQSDNTFRSDLSRSLSTTSATQRRLQQATVTAAKRGALSLVIFIVCYMPLMVALLVLSLDNPVYETALLLEGLTLPISYVHALVSPLLAMRVDKEWRGQAAALLRRWFRCCCKIQPR